MYAVALTLSGATTVATAGVPFFQLGSLGPIQSFGIIVAAGVLIGAALLRRYAEWHGVDDDHIRGLLGWVTICGFLGAHEFDMIAYNWDKIGVPANDVPPGWWILPEGLWVGNWPLPLRIWDGISSYGGFLGGAMGFAFYVWWKRLPVRLMADITIVGLLPAFSIGRIGCTAVSDHVGAAVKDPDAWYAFLAMDYPRSASTNLTVAHLFQQRPDVGDHILAWNLGFVELLYLIPVNAAVLWLAFRSTRRLPAGFVTVLTGILYAPVRFFLDYLRPENSDPRHLGLTFAQWSSILAFGVSVYVTARILKNGKPAATIAATSREAQDKLRVILKEEEEAAEVERKGKGKGAAAAASKVKEATKRAASEPEEEKAAAERDDEKAAEVEEKAAAKAEEKAAEKAEEKAEEAEEKAAAKAEDKAAAKAEPADEGAEVDAKAIAEAAKPADAAKPAQAAKPVQGAKPAGASKPQQAKKGGGGGKGKGKKR
jgi:phosphatidylglycerol:prolipoprotein diacylglycerol transferase